MATMKQSVKIDEDTEKNITPTALLVASAMGDAGEYELEFHSLTFIHAYALLGQSVQRFGLDLRLYLGTVKTFFEGGIDSDSLRVSLTHVSATDAKRRLSEDLGVALSSLFMVEAFLVRWETIAQIPQNSKLSKKRPDFEAFSIGDERYLFESKGTTQLGGVEAAMAKAVEQVKGYPEASNSKLAIVSYIPGDSRLFTGQTFVVDPPALPDIVDPSLDTAMLLHGERVFQFAGLPLTAAAYLRVLAKQLKDDLGDSGVVEYAARDEKLYATYLAEREQQGLTREVIDGMDFIGQSLQFDELGRRIFFGAQVASLEALTLMSPSTLDVALVAEQLNERQNLFPDGTILCVYDQLGA